MANPDDSDRWVLFTWYYPNVNLFILLIVVNNYIKIPNVNFNMVFPVILNRRISSFKCKILQSPKMIVTCELLANIFRACHSERSEESRFFNRLKSFTSFRMTENIGFEMACRKICRSLSGKDNLKKFKAGFCGGQRWELQKYQSSNHIKIVT